MAGYVMGLGILAFALWRWREEGVPDGAIIVPGTIIEELERRTTRPQWAD